MLVQMSPVKIPSQTFMASAANAQWGGHCSIRILRNSLIELREHVRAKEGNRVKSIALEQHDERIIEALKQNRADDPILLTQGSDALGLLLPLPEGTKKPDVDVIAWLQDSAGASTVFIQAKYGSAPGQSELVDGEPVYGRCEGMLTIESEDDEHLKDFAEYMK